jgi:hypothetical protein
MLEHAALLLPPPGPSGRRAIVAADTGVPLGFARRGGHAELPWWRRPLWPVLEVREQDDEPLLFTVRHCWSWRGRRELCDADGRRLGTLLGDAIDDLWGRRLALRSWTTNRTVSTFRTPRGQALASTSADEAGLCLTFAEPALGEPFLKMLLLGAVLLNGEVVRW